MKNANGSPELCDNKQIEDVIDARKQNGEYNVAFNPTKSVNSQNYTCRYAYSTPRGVLEERFVVPDETAMWNIEGDLNSDRDGNVISVGPTDSEITVVRVKRESSHLKESENKWDMHDKAIPGDGTHLGESPSLVNLVTLVKSSKQRLNTTAKENDEYLVPLSSWDPLDQSHEILDVDSVESKRSSDSCGSDANSKEEEEEEEVDDAREKIEIIKPPSAEGRGGRGSNLAARLLSFFRKRFKKS